MTKSALLGGNPETTTGGNALKFYASVRIDIRKSTPIKKGEEILGYLTKVKVVKNKVAPPFKRANLTLSSVRAFPEQVRLLTSVLLSTLSRKSGSWFSYGDSKLAQGRDAVKKLLMENPELAEELEAKIKEQLFNKEGDEPVINVEDDEEPEADATGDFE